MTEFPVVIVGGGPVGLTASILLSRAGIRSLLVERHPGTAVHPKARAINVRSMEMFRQCGVEAAIRAAGLPPQHSAMIIWAKTLAGEEIERRVPWRAGPQAAIVSPVRNCLCSQDDLEPVLRRFAEQGPGELKFSTEALALEQDADGITVQLADRESGETKVIRASYVIAADGAHSPIRKRLGVKMLGEADVYDSVNIAFKADLTPWTAERPAPLYFIENEKIRGSILTVNGRERWAFLISAMAAFGLTASDVMPERAIDLIRLAVGVPDLAIEISAIGPWTASAHVAEQYRWGRIFLIGDAAHEMPPTGGFGMNTGLQDVQNLAWKLAGVLKGAASPALLDTYHDERQPVARAITEQSLLNATSMGRLEQTRKNAGARPEYLNEQGMIFGAAYASRAVVPDGTPPPAIANAVTEYAPSARPGARAPHVFFQHDGQKLSTIDVVGDGFALLAAGEGGAWIEAASDVAGRIALPLKSFAITDEAFASAYGLEPSGAVLVRPDGHVGWRSRTLTREPARTLREAMSAILHRRPIPQAPLRFRRATLADAAKVRALTRAAYAKWVPLIGREPKPMNADYRQAVSEHLIDLYEEEGQLLGLVEIIPNSDHVLIENIAVDPEHHGKGYGDMLLKHAEDSARALGVGETRLYTNAMFAANLAFYAKRGYTEFDRETLAPGAVAVHMRKAIADCSAE